VRSTQVMIDLKNGESKVVFLAGSNSTLQLTVCGLLRSASRWQSSRCNDSSLQSSQISDLYHPLL